MIKYKTLLLSCCLTICVFVAGCKNPPSSLPIDGKAHVELPAKVQNRMRQMNMAKNSPILVRIFKEESTLEIWKQRRDGQYALISSYEICKWSGKLGPKFVEGDRQAPEGFYTVRPAQMNPNSQYYLAFNIGYPNAYDRANGRTGSHLMVHGACSSAGCYSMSDENIAEIYAFGRDSFKGGQQEFQVQAFPFRMTQANMARYRHDPNYSFWQMLKKGSDIFEATNLPPKVDVCEKRYVFNQQRKGDRSLDPSMVCSADSAEAGIASGWAQDRNKAVFLPGGAVAGTGKKAPAASIQGLEEARLVADWSRRRARGEKVTAEPPSLTLNPSAAVKMATGGDDTTASYLSTTGEDGAETATPGAGALPAATLQKNATKNTATEKKKGWSLFRSKQ